MDLTTIGVKFGYGVETTAGTKPAAFTQLKRCKSIGGIELTPERIDVTALEDAVKQYAAGVEDTGGDWKITFGVNDEVIEALETLKSEADIGKTGGKATWFEVYFPALTKAFYVVAEVGQLAMPDVSQGSAAEFPLNLTINEYKGLDTAIEPA